MRSISKRLFIGVDINDREIVNRLVEVRDKIKDLGKQNPTRREKMHITIGFLGDVSIRKTEKLVERLKLVEHQGFRTKIMGVDTFPNRDYIRVVYTGTEIGQLKSLRTEIMRKLPKDLKIKGENDYIPHITLSRVKNISGKKKKYLKDRLETLKDVRIGEIEVNRFQLKESIRRKDRSVYRTVHEYELDHK